MDNICKSLIYGGEMVLVAMDTTSLAREGARIHSLKGREAVLFAEVLTFGAYLGSMLKSDRGSASVVVKAGGSVSVSCDSALHVRGCMDGDTDVLTGGYIDVISDDGYGRRPFVGTCLMPGEDMSQNFEYYFSQSVQSPAAVRLYCDERDGEILSAGGVIGTGYPGAPDGILEKFAGALEEAGDLAREMTSGADVFSDRYFGGDILSLQKPAYRCNCSREKTADILRSVGLPEFTDICATQGFVNVHCHYCNKDYIFTAADIGELFPDGRRGEKK